MHFLIFLILLLGLGLYFYSQGAGSNKNDQPPSLPNSDNDMSNNLRLLFLSDGKLFQFTPDRAISQITSSYVEASKERQERSKKLDGWKQGTTWDTSFAQMRGMGPRNEESEVIFSSVIPQAENKLLYFLKGSGFGGLFEYCDETGEELRLLHRQNLDYQDLSRPNAKGEVLVANQLESGVANVAVIHPTENTYREVTGGDTLDLSPVWVDNKGNQIVYQSQGLARDAQGYIKGMGPAELNLINLETGDLKTIFSDEKSDFMKPMVSGNGTLYFIKRPYESETYSNSSIVLDALLFPFRLLRAVFHYLNFFSLMYSRKPLTSAGGPRVDQDVKEMIIRGRRIDTEKALKKGFSSNQTPALVPKSWVLISCDLNGNQEQLATNVASYGINDEGDIIYTNGCAVFCIKPNGRHHKVLQERLVQEVYLY